MNKEVDVLLVEDDPGHAKLVKKNLHRVGLDNEIKRFKDGQEVLDFLDNKELTSDSHRSYLILLDIRMPKVDGIEVLRKIKNDPELSKLPVIMLTTTDDSQEVNTCHQLGCSNYIVKPVNYEEFIETIKKLGLFLKIVETPELEGVQIDGSS